MKKIFIFSILCLLMAFGLAPKTYAQYDPCAIYAFPYTEGFESVSSGIPDCFARNPLGIYQNGTLYPEVRTVSPHTGNGALEAFNNSYSDTAAQVPTIVLPPVGEPYAMTDMVLEFWGQTVWNTSPYFVVGVMENSTDFSTFTEVQTVVSTAMDTYVKYTVYFSNYTGTGRYIAIKMANTPGVFGRLCIDDIVIDVAALCSPVLNLAVDNIFDADVTINWQPNTLGGASMYNVRLVNLDDESEFYATTTDTFYTFSSLAYSTNYRAFVTVTCLDNQESAADSVDFSTPIQSVSFPYFEDFEGEVTSVLAPFTFSGTGVNQWVYGTAAGMPDPEAEPGTAMHSIYVSPDSGATNVYTNSVSDAYAVFNVAFPTDDVEYHLAFDYRVEGEASDYAEFDYFKVYMIDAGATIPTSGAPSGTALLHNLSEVANHPDWTHFDVILNNVSGTAKQIVFYWYNNGWNLYGDSHLAAAVDNISLYANDCGQPDNLSASDITTDGATLNWNEFGSASNWTVYYRAVGSAAEYNEVNVNGTPSVTVFGLTSNTEYEFYVVANCGATQSNPSNTATFHTGCGPITELPFTENFETGLYSTSQNTFITCWSRLTSNNDHFAYIGDGSWYAHGGDHYLDFHYTPNCFDIAIMPELGEDFDASDMLLTFYACHTNYGYNTLGTLEVGVMTDPNDTSSFVVVDTINISELSGYTYAEQMVSLINYSGNGKYIAFRVSNSEGCGYYIDDITLDLRPACMSPVNFSATDVTTESVTLTWSELGNASAWTIQYDTAGFTAGQGTHTVTANTIPFTVTGLDNLTAYDFYVQANCGDSQSEWTGPLFITTGVLNMGVTGSDTLTTCEAIIADNGGVTGDYSTYCDYSVVVYPATEGSGLQITGTCDLSEGSYGYGESHLYFYEGVGTNGALIANYTGVNNNIAVASSGPITVRFTSSYNAGAGFVLNVACASCTPPTNLAVEEVNPTSATLSWEGVADQYAVYLSGDANGYYTSSYNSLTLNNLNTNSTYNVQVRALCGADSSLLSPTVTFTTPCNAITITAANPWTEDFESYEGTGNQPFQCWARPVVDDIYDAPFVYCGWEPSCHSGANSAELKGSSEMLVLPLFSNDIHELRLSFWATSTDPSSGLLEIGVIPNVTDPSSFELVGTSSTPGPRGTDSTGNGNYIGPFDFSGVTATNGRIALRYSNNFASYNSWNLDDFVVELAPNCSAPSDVTVSNITTSSANVSWTADLGATEWKLQYKAANVSVWSTEEDCIAPTFELTNLIPSTTYDVRVKTLCDDENESAWSNPVSFTTESAVIIEEPTVETTAASNITTNSATLNATITDLGNQTILVRGFEWKLSTAASYENLAGAGSGNTFSATLAGLTANTGYTFRAYVTTVNGTQYGEAMTFTTLPEGTPEPCEAPTGLHITDIQNESLAIAWDANTNVSSWNVQYRPLATPSVQWSQVTVNTNSCTITGLTGLTIYEIQVQADCGDNNVSEWSVTLTEQTTNVGIENHLLNSISLYPNPANDFINVQCIMYNVQLEGIEVIDVYGKVVRTVVGANDYSPTQINVSGLANGMYFVRVTTKEGVVTKNFIKR